MGPSGSPVVEFAGDPTAAASAATAAAPSALLVSGVPTSPGLGGEAGGVEEAPGSGGTPDGGASWPSGNVCPGPAPGPSPSCPVGPEPGAPASAAASGSRRNRTCPTFACGHASSRASSQVYIHATPTTDCIEIESKRCSLGRGAWKGMRVPRLRLRLPQLRPDGRETASRRGKNPEITQRDKVFINFKRLSCV